MFLAAVRLASCPWLSARTGAPLLSDCLSLEATGDGFRALRTLYGGKLHGRFTAAPGECGVLATLRSGAFAAAQRPAEATITPWTKPNCIHCAISAACNSR